MPPTILVTLSATHPLPPRTTEEDIRRHLAWWYPDSAIEVERRWASDRVVVDVELEPLDPRPVALVCEQIRARVLAFLVAHWEVA